MAITSEEDYNLAVERTEDYLSTTGFESYKDLNAAFVAAEDLDLTTNKMSTISERIVKFYSSYTPEQQKYLKSIVDPKIYAKENRAGYIKFNDENLTNINADLASMKSYRAINPLQIDDTTQNGTTQTGGINYAAIATEVQPSGNELWKDAGYGSVYEYIQALQEQGTSTTSPITEAIAAGMPTTADEVAAADYMARQEDKARQDAFFENVWGSDDDFATSFKNFFTDQKAGLSAQADINRADIERQYQKADIVSRQNLARRGISPDSGLAIASENQLLGMRADAQGRISQDLGQQQLQVQQNFLQMGMGMQPNNIQQLQGYSQQLNMYQQNKQMQNQLQMQQVGFEQQNQLAQMQYGWQKDLMQMQIDSQKQSALYSLAGTALGTFTGASMYKLIN